MITLFITSDNFYVEQPEKISATLDQFLSEKCGRTVTTIVIGESLVKVNLFELSEAQKQRITQEVDFYTIGSNYDINTALVEMLPENNQHTLLEVSDYPVDQFKCENLKLKPQ